MPNEYIKVKKGQVVEIEELMQVDPDCFVNVRIGTDGCLLNLPAGYIQEYMYHKLGQLSPADFGYSTSLRFHNKDLAERLDSIDVKALMDGGLTAPNKRITPEEAHEMLRKPYHWVFKYDQVGDYWFGQIKEFQGCHADGHSIEECFCRLRDTAVSWILSAANTLGQTIPEPEV